MSALGGYWRFQVKNGTGGTGSSTASTIKMQRWKPDSAGAADYETEQTAFSQGSIGSGSYSNGTAYDNDASNGYGYHGLSASIKIVNGSSAGNWYVYLQLSTDGGTSWGDNGTGEPIAVVVCAASATVKTTVNV